MPVEIIDGVEHIYAPNPTMHGEDWAREHPPVKTTSRWLRNKFTGEIVPNHPEFAERSDVYEAFLGDPSNPQDQAAPASSAPLVTAAGAIGEL